MCRTRPVVSCSWPDQAWPSSAVPGAQCRAVQGRDMCGCGGDRVGASGATGAGRRVDASLLENSFAEVHEQQARSCKSTHFYWGKERKVRPAVSDRYRYRLRVGILWKLKRSSIVL